MCLLVESIRIEEGKPQLLDHHNRRLNSSRAILFGAFDKIDLNDHMPDNIPNNQVLKWRVVYGKDVVSSETAVYQPKIIDKLKLVDSGITLYDHKYLERIELNKLYDKKGDADEIIMINAQGEITDAYYFSLVFEKNSQYFTPQSFMLPSVMRSYLLDEKIILQRQITIHDLYDYERIHLINALNPLGCQYLNINTETIIY